MGCRCEHLPHGAQRTAHTIHTAIEERIRLVRDLSQRYLPFLRPHVPDPTILHMVQEDGEELRALHQSILRALPEPEQTHVFRSYPQAVREYIARERRNSDHGTTQ